MSEVKEEKKEVKKDDTQMDETEDQPIKSLNSNVSTPILHTVIVHPLVLLSVVDHYTRVAKDTSRRVVGVLLGEITRGGKVDITNSYAIPFEEDPNDLTAWYVDKQYHQEMYGMFRKVAAAEKIVGWYSTGPKIKQVDIEINELFREYTPDPVFVIIDVNPSHSKLEIPTQAYISIESRPEEQSKSMNRRQFKHLICEIGAYEAEEVGVEHLLRGVVDSTESSLADHIGAKLNSLRGLKNRLNDINKYLDNVVQGNLPINNSIIYNLQDIFSYIPDLGVTDLVKSFSVNSNDNHMIIYLSSIVRSILSLHDLINNKLTNRQFELDEGKTEEQKKKEKAEREEALKKKKIEAEKAKAEGKGKNF